MFTKSGKPQSALRTGDEHAMYGALPYGALPDQLTLCCCAAFMYAWTAQLQLRGMHNSLIHAARARHPVDALLARSNRFFCGSNLVPFVSCLQGARPADRMPWWQGHLAGQMGTQA